MGVEDSSWNTGLSVKTRNPQGKHKQIGHSPPFPTVKPGQVKRTAETLLLGQQRLVGASPAWQSPGALLVSGELHNREEMDMIQHRHEWENIHTPKYNLQVAPLDGVAQPD